MLSWFRQIDNARSPLEVVAVARDYVASWMPHDLGRLPPACRPGKLRDAIDIEDLHARLVEEYRVSRSTGEDLRLLQELTSFMVRASIRVAELGNGAPTGGSENPGAGPTKAASPPES